MTLLSKMPVPKVKVTCAYCGGTGVDKFGLLRENAQCNVCSGKGYHILTMPLVKCAYCRGTGVSPIGGRYYCLACGGTGVHQRPKTKHLCPECNGTGVAKGGSGLYCHACHGSGLKTVYPDPKVA